MPAFFRNEHSNRSNPDVKRMLFDLAWNRLSRFQGIRRWEFLFQAILAAYLGFLTFHLISSTLDAYAILAIYALIMVSTPFIIGILIESVHLRSVSLNEIFKTTPVPPVAILDARFTAVALTWLRLFSPLLILAIVAILKNILQPGITEAGWGRYILYQLAYFNDRIFDVNQLEHMTERLLTPILAILQAISWVTLPISWGLLQGVIFHNNRPAFWITYLLYLLFPISMSFFFYSCVQRFSYALAPEIATFHFRVLTIFSGTIGLVVSILFFIMACVRISGRTK